MIIPGLYSRTSLRLEIQFPSFSMAVKEEMTNERKVDLCLIDLEAFDKERLVATEDLEIV